VEFEGVTAMKVKIMIFWNVPGVVWWLDTNILEETVASFFRIKEHSHTPSDKTVLC
jgi:hypothetical protein